MSRKKKATLVVALLVAVLTLSIGYAALSASLNINGTANVSGEKWQVNFVKNEATESSTGQATCDIGTIEDTSITDLSAVFKIPGDSCTFTVPVENTGTLSASLSDVIGKDSLLTLTGTEEDQAILENSVEYSVNYGTIEINDKTVFNSINTLEPGEKETITLKVAFKSEATKVPKASVTVGGLDRTFVFENKQATSVAEKDTKYSVTYEGIEADDYVKSVRKGTSYIQNLGKGAELCSVKMSGRTLSTSQYTFENGVITISNVTGDIVINAYVPTIESATVPNPPELNGDMIPVYYDNGWKKADVSNTSNSWYDYANQKWANAVTIISDKREEVKGYLAGTVIPMNYINTMWVWIPRYSYTIKSENGTDYYGKRSSCTIPSRILPGEIDVKFITKDQNETTGNAQYTGDEAINWRTNEAFNFGGEQHAGIWVGKFEPTGTLEKNGQACENTNCNVSNVTIKPGEASLRSQKVSSFFYMARSMQVSYADTYGFNANSGDLHMMKNDEWGAVAYLSQSRYGKQRNNDYSGVNKEIYQNKSSSYITGSSNGTPSQKEAISTQHAYNSMTELGSGKGQAGPGASTTGNITGIYDMSGGAEEYVMGVLEYDSQTESEHPGEIATGGSGFKGLNDSGRAIGTVDLPNEKYYNKYKSAKPTSSYFPNINLDSACDGEVCFGQALSGTENWYNDYAYFVTRTYPWFTHGGDYNLTTGAGVFNADDFNGGSYSSYSCRLVLV